MFTTVIAQVDPDTLRRLIQHMQRHGQPPDVSAAINTALKFWLDESVKLASEPSAARQRGYQWKTVFLPEGTILRSWSYGEHNYAEVIGDQIIHQGRSVSPNQFARSFARSMRNAWIDLSIRRPGEHHYTIASRLRDESLKKD
ncbi:hypothetical protein ACFFKC_04515 [Pseudoduganella danionis]|uniref:Uncharacterized protein n=1 Tax=Pseudoduganella danionis TaxID=1890295 RepID=A0ABW9SGT8_9BURK|nr:hypothetical protein [Pseudoduganella danionis]MTW31223.1 hypothetical protein [Pseudoduganella danionis]